MDGRDIYQVNCSQGMMYVIHYQLKQKSWESEISKGTAILYCVELDRNFECKVVSNSTNFTKCMCTLGDTSKKME